MKIIYTDNDAGMRIDADFIARWSLGMSHGGYYRAAIVVIDKMGETFQLCNMPYKKGTYNNPGPSEELVYTPHPSEAAAKKAMESLLSEFDHFMKCGDDWDNEFYFLAEKHKALLTLTDEERGYFNV